VGWISICDVLLDDSRYIEFLFKGLRIRSILADSVENLSSLLMADGVVFGFVILGFLWYCVDVCSG
jgi:hypothetical protein